MSLPETFFNLKQAREKANHSSKKSEGKKKGGKENSKVKNFDFCACLDQNVLNAILVAKQLAVVLPVRFPPD